MSTAKPSFVPSFYTLDQRPTNMNSIKQLAARNHHVTSQPRAASSKDTDPTAYLVSGGNAANSTHHRSIAEKAMLSISPIRFDRDTKSKTGYPTQQLMARGGTSTSGASMTIKEEASKPLPPLQPMSAGGSRAFIKNLSNHFVGEDTPAAPHSLQNLSTFSVKAEVPIKQETDDIANALDDKYVTYKSFAPDGTPIKQEDDANDTDVAIKQEPSDLDDNLTDMDYYYNDTHSAFQDVNIPTDTNTIDVSTLDAFELNTNGSFDFETFPSSEIEASFPDPKGIYAMKATARRTGPNTNKPKSKKSSGRKTPKSNNEPSTTAVFRPTDLDVLRGRGGLTNHHAGNKRFRDEARKLRREYRDSNTDRQKKFKLSLVRTLLIM
jgi:hypothetical protein